MFLEAELEMDLTGTTVEAEYVVSYHCGAARMWRCPDSGQARRIHGNDARSGVRDQLHESEVPTKR